MGCGNLVFAHDNRFNRETLAQTGIFFKTPLQLTRVISEAERRPDRIEQKRRATSTRARAHYRWPDIVGQYAALLEQSEERRKAA